MDAGGVGSVTIFETLVVMRTGLSGCYDHVNGGGRKVTTRIREIKLC